MGLLRLILALSVFIVHTGSFYGLNLVGSSVAVQSFFVISGFYMSLILNEKYKGPGSYYLFITNRFLRLLPAHWVVLALAVAVIYSLRPYSSEDPLVSFSFDMYFPLQDIKAQVLILFSNVFMLGHDLLNLLRVDPQTGFFALTMDPSKAYAGVPPVLTFFFNPPAWSLGTELLFYLVAPFLVRRRKRVLLALVSLSLLLRVVMFYSGYRHTAWQFQFFPTELALFLMGALSYRLYKSGSSFFSSRFGLCGHCVDRRDLCLSIPAGVGGAGRADEEVGLLPPPYIPHAGRVQLYEQYQDRQVPRRPLLSGLYRPLRGHMVLGARAGAAA